MLRAMLLWPQKTMEAAMLQWLLAQLFQLTQALKAQSRTQPVIPGIWISSRITSGSSPPFARFFSNLTARVIWELHDTLFRSEALTSLVHLVHPCNTSHNLLLRWISHEICSLNSIVVRCSFWTLIVWTWFVCKAMLGLSFWMENHWIQLRAS